MTPRTITKLRLARLYCPDMRPDAARLWLWRRLRDTPGLMEALKKSGYNPSSKKAHFSRRECALILRYLGDP